MALFNTNNDSKILKVHTEMSGIDILIETSNEIIVIENKLKSSQHSDQLTKYKEYCDHKFPQVQKRFYFLTLTGEKSNDVNWRRMSYYQMYEQLHKLPLNDEENHTVIVREYLVFLQRLTSCVNDFISRPHDYDMVFMDGKKKKIDKINCLYATPNERFIASNQLETILQKCFLHGLSEQIDTNISFVSDTRGDALIDFPIRSGIIYKNRNYSTILQLQQDNIKFAFAIFGEGYVTSRKEWIEGAIPLMELLRLENVHGYTKVNKPKSKAYISVSKKLNINYWKMAPSVLKDFIVAEIANAEKMTGFLVGKLQGL